MKRSLQLNGPVFPAVRTGCVILTSDHRHALCSATDGMGKFHLFALDPIGERQYTPATPLFCYQQNQNWAQGLDKYGNVVYSWQILAIWSSLDEYYKDKFGL